MVELFVFFDVWVWVVVICVVVDWCDYFEEIYVWIVKGVEDFYLCVRFELVWVLVYFLIVKFVSLVVFVLDVLMDCFFDFVFWCIMCDLGLVWLFVYEIGVLFFGN